MLCRIRKFYGLYLVLTILGASSVLSEKDATRNENRHKPWFAEAMYRGEVKENERDVRLHPALVATDIDADTSGEICAYHIVEDNVPFEVHLDPHTKEAKLKAIHALNCEAVKEYTFHLQATDCGSPPKYSHKVSVHVEVEDVNEHSPHFEEPSYEVAVEAGVLYHRILEVHAIDDDCSAGFSAICDYEIVTPNLPFNISKTGVITNTEPLVADMERQIMSVAAYDCGGMRSNSVMVTVKVKAPCQPGWKKVPDRIEYVPGSGRRQLAPFSYLDLCRKPPCEEVDVTASLKLQTDHIGKGCDRDTYSAASLRKLCGASSQSIELLPSPGVGARWTQDLVHDEGHESDQLYQFDGQSSAVPVPDWVVPKNLTSTFSINTWMKHSPNYDGSRETILCSSDKTVENRHHYSLYLHNCRLTLLLRQQSGQGPAAQQTTPLPTEFLWKAPELCDKDWHHYVVNVDYPEVRLYVDGVPVQVQHVANDGPIRDEGDINTQLTVGAAWQGGDHKFVQYFKGYLAGLTIHPGRTEAEPVIVCLSGCKESLEFHNYDLLTQGRMAEFNAAHSEVTFKGRLVGDELNELIRKVSYVNTRQYPTPGKRSLTIQTQATCDGIAMEIPDLKTYVSVLKAEEPQITLTGPSQVGQKAANFEKGVEILANVQVMSAIPQEILEEEVVEEVEVGHSTEEVPLTDGASPQLLHNLDSCSIRVDPPLDRRHEAFALPAAQIAQHRLYTYNSTEGFVIQGVDTLLNYQGVLHQVRYINRDLVHYYERKFTLTCSELNGRYKSNDLDIKVILLHEAVKPQPQQHGHHKVPSKDVAAKNKVHSSSGAQKVNKDASNMVNVTTSTSKVIAGVIVSCIAFLLFMIVLGVFRIRAAHRRSQNDDRQEMAWDDSSLTITVNPMEGGKAEKENDSDMSDDDYEDDLNTSEEEEEEEPPAKDEHRHQLEWDDSTL